MRDREQQPKNSNPVTQDEDRDPTVSKLLVHLKEMRESVPVNYQLKQELKKKLLAQMMQMGYPTAGHTAERDKAKHKYRWWLVLTLCFVILLSGAAYWEGRSQVNISDWQPMTVVDSVRIHDADLSNQNQVVFLVEDRLLIYNDQGQKIRSLSLPIQGDKILGITSSPRGDEVAWVKQGDKSNEVWISNMVGGGSRLVIETPAVNFKGMNWSLDGRWIYTSLGEEIWKISTFSPESAVIGQGINPVVSPNGKYLVVIHDHQMEIWDEKGVLQTKLGAGQSPVWLDDERILFVNEKSRLMMWHPFLDKKNVESVSSLEILDGSPMLRVSADRKRILAGNISAGGWKISIGKLDMR